MAFVELRVFLANTPGKCAYLGGVYEQRMDPDPDPQISLPLSAASS